jgi:WD40 repeat protein
MDFGEALGFFGGPAFEYRPLSVAWSPDGTKIASCFGTNIVTIKEATTGKQVQVYQGHTDFVEIVAWSPDGTRLASASHDHILHVWSTSTGERLFSLSAAYTLLAWSPDGTRLASSAPHANPIDIRDAITGKLVVTYPGHHPHALRGLAWSPDSTRIASIDLYDSIHIWDAATGQLIDYYGDRSGHSHKNGHALAWSPDGTRLAASVTAWPAGTRGIDLWEVATRRLLYTYRGHPHPPLGPGSTLGGEVETLAWSPESTRLASGSQEGIVQVWQAI